MINIMQHNLSDRHHPHEQVQCRESLRSRGSNSRLRTACISLANDIAALRTTCCDLTKLTPHCVDTKQAVTVKSSCNAYLQIYKLGISITVSCNLSCQLLLSFHSSGFITSGLLLSCLDGCLGNFCTLVSFNLSLQYQHDYGCMCTLTFSCAGVSNVFTPGTYALCKGMAQGQ